MDNQVVGPLELAARYHAGQMRKWGNPPLPYITHPLSVAALVAEFDNEPDVLAAAVCHDVLEDTDCSRDELLSAIGERACGVVLALTNFKVYGLNRAAQKALDRESLSLCGSITHLVKACDRLHNLLSLADAPESFRTMYLAESRLLFDVLADSLPEVLLCRIKKILEREEV